MSIQPLTIPYLIPDMPSAEEIMPFLREIDGNRWYTNFGPLVTKLHERILQTHFSDDRVNLLLCSTGTAALELGLQAMGLKKGARILVPAFTFPASANAIQNCGFEPVFCDVDENSWVLTPDIALDAIARSDIHAVMPVAALGRPLSADAWDEFCDKTGLPVLIDAAAALGSQQVGKRIVVAYSMHATKAFGIGEGGLLAAFDEDLIARARRICNFGMDARGQVVRQGTNGKLSEYHAAVGLAQIARWSDRQLKRARVDAIYQAFMRPFHHLWVMQSYVDQKAINAGVLVSHPVRHNRTTMPVRLRQSVGVSVQDIQDALASHGIGTRLWYNPGLHQHPHWEHCERVGRFGQQALVTVDSLNKQVIGLPFHNFLTSDEIGFAVKMLQQTIENREISASL